MLDALGIPRRMMPERLVAPSDVVGGLPAEAAARLGLPAGTPVVAGGVDAAVATFAAGVVQPGQHVAMIGTSMCWGTIAPPPMQPRPGRDALRRRHRGRPLRVRRRRHGGGRGGLVPRAVLPGRGDAGRAQGRDPHALLEEAAAGLPPGSDGIVFLPYLMGERSPVWDGQASGAFVGLNLFHTRAHLYRAVLEGVTLALRHNMEAGAKAAAALDRRLIVVGGAAKSDLWMQIIADVTGLPVWTIREDVEAALGAARLAALGCGLIRRDDTGNWITLVERAVPDPPARRGTTHSSPSTPTSTRP